MPKILLIWRVIKLYLAKFVFFWLRMQHGKAVKELYQVPNSLDKILELIKPLRNHYAISGSSIRNNYQDLLRLKPMFLYLLRGIQEKSKPSFLGFYNNLIVTFVLFKQFILFLYSFFNQNICY